MKSARKIFKRYVELFLLFVKYSFIEQMEYRVNFIAGIAVECGYILVKLMYVVLVYQAGTKINGLTPDHMVMFIGTYVMMTGFYMAVYPNFCMLPQYVREGTLDMLITKPVNLQFITTLKRIDFSMPIPSLLCGISLICFGWRQANLPVTVKTVSGFILLSMSGIVISYFLFLLPKLLSFWFVSANGLNQISDAAWDFNNMPMNIYGKRMRLFGIFVIPIFLITNFPALFVMNRLNVFMVIWGFLAPCLLYILIRVVWKHAMRHYSSASS
ncbi:MAG TPA: ABC-2 family transporter protein [Lachnospiraceae bacterium]|nr:ABC-2 family transporter protein [Lachnospiraceae bacterium]